MNLLEGAASPTKTSTKNLHNRVNVSLKSKLLTHSTQLGNLINNLYYKNLIN